MARTPTVFSRHADLLKVLVGETISDFGSQVGDLALPLLAAITLEATAGQMASLMIAEYLPRILVGVIAAAWIDRLRRRPLLIATNLARFAVLAALALAGWTHVLSIALVAGAAVALTSLDVVFTGAFAAYIPTLVPTAMLAAANGARATSSASAGVIGPAIAGALISVFGAPVALLVDAVSFLASVLGLTGVRAVESPVHAAHSEPRSAIAEGWRALLNEPTLRAIFGLGGGLGVLIGSALAAPIGRRFRIEPSMIAAHLLFGVFGIPLALTAFVPKDAAPLVFASEFLQLAVNAVYMVNRTSVEQAISPPVVRGRIQTNRNVVHAVAGVLGLAAGGLLGTALAPGAAIVVGVIGGFTSFAWLLRSPLRRLDELPA